MLEFSYWQSRCGTAKLSCVNGDGADPLAMPRTLATARLHLRQFRRDDASDVNSFADDPEYRRYLGPDHPSAAAFLDNNVNADWDRAPSWAIELDGRVVGGVFFGIDAETRRAELASLVSPAHWRKGIGLEACRAVVEQAFAIGIVQVWARADAENAASITGMERLGMHPDEGAATGIEDDRDDRNEVRYVLDRDAAPPR